MSEHNRLDPVIERMVRLDILIEQCDEWQRTYWETRAKQELLEQLPLAYENLEEQMEALRDTMYQSEALYEAAKLQISKMCNLSVEEARMRVVRARSLLSANLESVAEEARRSAGNLTEEEILSMVEILLEQGE